jgi:hypothetical protein
MKAWRQDELGETSTHYYAMRRCANLEDEYIKPIFEPPAPSSPYGRVNLFKPLSEKKRKRLEL